MKMFINLTGEILKAWNLVRRKMIIIRRLSQLPLPLGMPTFMIVTIQLVQNMFAQICCYTKEVVLYQLDSNSGCHDNLFCTTID